MDDFCCWIDDDLALLPPLPRHGAAQFEAVERSRERIGRWLNWVENTTAVEHVVATRRNACRALGRRRGFQCGILHRGEAAGSVGVSDVHRVDRCGEFGYWLAEGHEGGGVMTRCVPPVLAHAHGAMRLRRVYLCASAGNERSQRVMQRSGCTREATLAAGDPLSNGEVTDQVMYAHLGDAGEPVEFALPTAKAGVSLALVQPHHARAWFAIVDRERERLGRTMRFVHRQRRVRDVRRFIAREWDAHADETGVSCVILRDGQLVGGISVHGMGGVARRGGIGYWLAEAAEGQGVMSASLCAFGRHLWANRPELVRLQLRIEPDNARSRKLAEACGFAYEGTLRDDFRIGGKTEDSSLYGMRRPG